MTKINLTLITVLFFACLQYSTAQIDTITFDEFRIYAPAPSALNKEDIREVQIISNEDLKALPVNNINDALELICGVDIRKRGDEGMQGDVSIRGGNFDQVIILLDGINITDPQTGHHSMNLPIDFEDIERIEILKGSAARIWGANAFSGAINIISKKNIGNTLRIGLTQGSNEYIRPAISTSFKTGKAINYVSASMSSSDGYRENTDLEYKNLFYKTEVQMNGASLLASVGYIDKAFGANSFYTPKYPNQFEQIRSSFANMQFRKHLNKTILEVKPYVRRHQDRFELFRYNPAIWYKGHNYHLTYTKGIKIDYTVFNSFGKTSIGTEYRNDFILSNVLGEERNEVMDVPHESQGKFSHDYQRNNTSVFADHSVKISNLTISGGAMLSSYNSNDYKVLPGMELNYKVKENLLSIYASYNESYRLPTFTDLFYVGPTNLGNKDLKPETSKCFEIGAKSKTKSIHSNVALFYNQGKNIIDWVKLNDTLLWQSMNHTELDTYGAEVTSIIDLKELGSKAFQQIHLGYAYANSDKESGEYISHYALDYLKHKISCRLNMKIINQLHSSIAVNYQDREGTYEAFDFETKNYVGEKDFEPFTLCDTKLYWKQEDLQMFLECSNLFDVTYHDYGNIPMPGRTFRWGVQMSVF